MLFFVHVGKKDLQIDVASFYYCPVIPGEPQLLCMNRQCATGWTGETSDLCSRACESQPLRQSDIEFE